jgi:hypothetical protein
MERIGFKLNARRSDWATAVGIERIQVKTRWTKAVGEAVGGILWGLQGERRAKQAWRHRCSRVHRATIGVG